MKSLSCKIVACVVLLAAVAGFAQTQTDSFKVAGVFRTYYMHAPTSGLSKPPLVFMFHGYGGNGASEESGDKWFPIADREKFIAVYPNAIAGNWNVSTTSNDLTFILAIIDSIDAKYHIDRGRIYVAGFSQGAAMSQTCGCTHSDVFAAMAAASGGLSGTCNLKRPVPVFVAFGGSGDPFASPAWSSVPLWLSYDSLSATPKVTSPYPSTNPKSVITRLTYGPGKNGVLIVVDSAHNGGHEWPMNTATEVNNSEEAWAFFKQFSLNAPTAVHQHSIAVSRDCFSATYRAGIVSFQGIAEKARVQVVDTRGRLIATGIPAQGQFALKDKPSGIYVVMVSRNNTPVAIRMVIP